MRSRWVGLSRPRRVMGDMLHFAAGVPTVPVQRRMDLGAVAAARRAAGVCWPAVFLKAYAAVARDVPALRRAFVRLPWPHLVEYDKNVVSVAVERDVGGEPAVFFGRVTNPEGITLDALHDKVKEYAGRPVGDVPAFREALRFAGLPTPVRRALMWLGLNVAGSRGRFGTFGLSVYSSLGAESLHPLSPLTTTLTYGVIGPTGAVDVRVVYDHRVLDGATVARALARLEAELTGRVADELRGIARSARGRRTA